MCVGRKTQVFSTTGNHVSAKWPLEDWWSKAKPVLSLCHWRALATGQMCCVKTAWWWRVWVALSPFFFSPFLLPLFWIGQCGWIDEDSEGRGQENVNAIFGLCLVRKWRINDSHHDGWMCQMFSGKFWVFCCSVFQTVGKIQQTVRLSFRSL